MKPLKYCKRLEDLSISDTGLAGGKNASLGEMLQALSKKGSMFLQDSQSQQMDTGYSFKKIILKTKSMAL